uniref:Uncharacterized protein n=1 Tax=Setaria viridis TaxID=4556 RepID=A0A4U6TMN0_SETVI|nr:hypothetical protein SEVIR_7G076800v2 [Setaria viridis]
MPPQDVPTQGHAAAATNNAAVVVHGHHSLPVVAPAVTGHGKERRRRKHEVDDAGGSGVVVAAARLSEIEAAAADGGATDGARRSHHHRRPRAPATEGTKSGSVMYDAASVRPERGFSAVVHYSESAPATARPAVIVIGSRRKHRAAGSYSTTEGGNSYYASDDHLAAASSSSSRLVRERRPASPRPHRPTKPNGAYSAAADGVPARAFTGGFGRYDSPSVTARSNGTVTGGKHRYHQATVGSSWGGGGGGGGAYYAAASSSSSRLIREPAAPPPPHHRPPKPHKNHGAPSSSAPPPPQEPSEDELLRVGLEVASKMDMATLHSMVKEHIDRNQEAEAVEEESLHFWRPLTDDEVDADLRAIYDKVAAWRAAASGSGKRRRH